MDSITIKPSGFVECRKKTEDKGNWRTTIAPGEWDEAERLLTAEQLAQVREAWTPELVAAYEAQQAAITAQYG